MTHNHHNGLVQTAPSTCQRAVGRGRVQRPIRHPPPNTTWRAPPRRQQPPTSVPRGGGATLRQLLSRL